MVISRFCAVYKHSIKWSTLSIGKGLCSAIEIDGVFHPLFYKYQVCCVNVRDFLSFRVR